MLGCRLLLDMVGDGEARVASAVGVSGDPALIGGLLPPPDQVAFERHSAATQAGQLNALDEVALRNDVDDDDR